MEWLVEIAKLVAYGIGGWLVALGTYRKKKAAADKVIVEASANANKITVETNRADITAKESWEATKKFDSDKRRTDQQEQLDRRWQSFLTSVRAQYNEYIERVKDGYEEHIVRLEVRIASLEKAVSLLDEANMKCQKDSAMCQAESKFLRERLTLAEEQISILTAETVVVKTLPNNINGSGPVS